MNKTLNKTLKRTTVLAFLCLMSMLALVQVAYADVGADGTFSYSIPIEMPDGINGMAPDLSLTYNSDSGNGQLGVGWALSGLPVIARDVAYPVNFDGNDHYVYNGQKLIYNTATGYYHTEKESYERIQVFNMDTSSSYWVVTQKDGTKLYFGNTNDSRIDAVGKDGKAVAWALNKVIDTSGNYYTVSYYEDTAGGDFYPAAITWTQNDAAQPSAVNSVEFSYEQRTDRWPMYVPTLVDMDNRMKWITVKVGGNLLRKYRIDYENGSSTGLSRLTTIQEYGSDGVSTLPPIKFQWQEGGSGFDIQRWASKQGGMWDSQKWMSGDFNGDGKTDLMKLWSENGTMCADVHISVGNNFVIQRWATQQGGIWDSMQWFVGDFNGDGKSDLAKLWNDNGTMDADVHLSTGSNFNIQRWATQQGGIWTSMQWFVGDFNGDGKSDLAKLWNDNGAMDADVHLSTGSNFNIQRWASQQGGLWDSQKWMTGEFNGDGKTDLAKIWNENGTMDADVHLSTGSNFNIQRWATQQGGIWDSQQWYIGDFNGDAKTDLAKIWNENGTFDADVHISTGNTFNIQRWATQQGGFWDSMQWMVEDFNGDGKSDLAKVWNDNGTMDADVHISNGTCFAIQRWASQQGGFWTSQQWMTGDFNGDGKSDLAKIWNENGAMYADVHPANSPVPDILTEIQNGIGGTIKVKYTNPSNIVNAYIPGASEYHTYAVNNFIAGSTSMVTSVEVNDGVGSSTSKSYQYYNGKYYNGLPHERRFLGFEWVKETDNTTGNYIQTWYRQDIPYEGMVDRQASFDVNGNKSQETQYEYTSRTDSGSPAGVKFVHITNIYNYEYDLNASYVRSRETYYFDSYGNVIEVYNHGQDTPALDYDETQTVTEYIYNTTDWIVDKAKKVYTNGYKGNDANTWGTKVETRYYYDWLPYGTVTKGNLTKEELENGTTDVTKQYGYDTWGNRVSATDGRNYTSTTTYDPAYHAYVTQVTNAKNWSVTSTYDNLMRALTVTDANGVVANTRYDVFSRVVKKWTTPDSETYPTEIIEYYNDGIAPEITRRLSRTDAGTANVIESRTYSDGLGRDILVKAASETSGQYTTVDTYYDSMGRVYRTSMPYNTSTIEYTVRDAAQKYTLNEYDVEDRVVRTTKPDGTYTRMFYDNNIIAAVDELNHVTGKKYDGQGNIIEYTQCTGIFPNQTAYATTTYQYDVAKGQLMKEIDPAGNVTQYAYDMLGRETSMTDPDMGIWTYVYDANGNITQMTDAKSQTIYYTYDELNRITKTDYPSGTDTLYYYDEAGYGYSKGRLTRVTYAAGSESMNYDERGRVTSETVTIDGISKTESFTYDSMDRLRTITYPDGEVVTNSYNAEGLLNSVTGTNSYVNNIDRNAMGLTTLITYGNGVTLNNDYYDTSSETDPTAGTAFSYRVKRSYTSTSGMFDLSYEYDNTGNVKKKNNAIETAYNETYTYDDLDRLISGVGVYGTKTFSYNNIGNITQKDGQNYTYGDSNHKHAVTAKGSAAYAYDANGNMTSWKGKTLTYNYDNMMTAFGADTFAYFGEDRVKKVEGTTTTRYFFDNYEEETTGTTTNVVKHYFADGQKVATRTTSQGLMYYITDQLHSSSVITDASGVLKKKMGYMPYGEDAYSIDVNSGNFNVDYRFTGKEKDASSLYYFGARYYDPDIGRFTTADTMIDGPNGYAYCSNNPVNAIDPTGHFSLKKAFKKVVKSVVKANLGAAKMLVSKPIKLVAESSIGRSALRFMNSPVGMAAMAVIPGGCAAQMAGRFAGALAAQQVSKQISNKFNNPLGQLAATIVGSYVGGYVSNSIGAVCFVAGTPVLTDKGKKTIENIKVGDMVYSMNEKTGEFGYKKVVKLFVNPAHDLVRVKVGNGQTIEATKEHPFFVIGSDSKGTWIAAGNLKKGMKLLDAKGNYVEVEGIEIIKRDTTVYNFEVEDWHTYFVGEGSVVVHNTCTYSEPSEMSVSDKGFKDLVKEEGFKTKIYDAQPGKGDWTIGIGHKLTPKEIASGVFKSGLNKDQIIELFRNDLTKFEDVIRKAVNVSLTQEQFDALTSFSYNIGGAAFRKSTVLRMLNSGDYAGAAEHMMDWKKPRIIIPRRTREMLKFSGDSGCFTGSKASSGDGEFKWYEIW